MRILCRFADFHGFSLFVSVKTSYGVSFTCITCITYIALWQISTSIEGKWTLYSFLLHSWKSMLQQQMYVRSSTYLFLFYLLFLQSEGAGEVWRCSSQVCYVVTADSYGLGSTQLVSVLWLTVPPGTTCHIGLGGSCRFMNGPARLVLLDLSYFTIVGGISFVDGNKVVDLFEGQRVFFLQWKQSSLIYLRSSKDFFLDRNKVRRSF